MSNSSLKVVRFRVVPRIIIAAALAALLILPGCATNRYQAPITSFQATAQQTVNVLSAFYASRNSYEIDAYLQTLAADPTLPVQTIDAQGAPTPLGKPVFSPLAIKARLDALNLVGVYASRLSDLVNSDAPAQFQSASTLLGQNFSSLDTTFQKIARTADPTAQKYAGPITSLIGTIGQMYLERKREELVAKAIKDGAPQVDTILSLVRDDMDTIFSLEVTTGASEKLAVMSVAYNNERANLSYEQRLTRLMQIKAASTEAAASVGSAPSGVVTSMLAAHHALVQLANSPPKTRITNLAQLNSALVQWTNQIQSVAAQVKILVH